MPPTTPPTIAPTLLDVPPDPLDAADVVETMMLVVMVTPLVTTTVETGTPVITVVLPDPEM